MIATLAAAHAECGNYEQATDSIQRALDLSAENELLLEMEKRFKDEQPYRYRE